MQRQREREREARRAVQLGEGQSESERSRGERKARRTQNTTKERNETEGEKGRERCRCKRCMESVRWCMRRNGENINANMQRDEIRDQRRKTEKKTKRDEKPTEIEIKITSERGRWSLSERRKRRQPGKEALRDRTEERGTTHAYSPRRGSLWYAATETMRASFLPRSTFPTVARKAPPHRQVAVRLESRICLHFPQMS